MFVDSLPVDQIHWILTQLYGLDSGSKQIEGPFSAFPSRVDPSTDSPVPCLSPFVCTACTKNVPRERMLNSLKYGKQTLIA